MDRERVGGRDCGSSVAAVTERIVVSTSGVNRSDPTGKPDYTLVDWTMIERWALHMEAHIGSKGRDNWRQASTQEDLDRFLASLLRHALAVVRGDADEDHAAALMFNVAGAELVRSRGWVRG